MSTNEPNVRRAVEALGAVLPSAVEQDLAVVADGVRADNAFVELAGRNVSVAWIGDGRLGDARRYLESPLVGDVAAARRLSPGARELLSLAGVGYVDETGAAEIAIGTLVVSRSGRSTPSAPRRPRWNRSVLAIAEAVLCGVKPTVSSTSDATGLSGGSCSNALRTLRDLGLLVSDEDRGPRSARRLDDPDALLAAYATAVEQASRPPSIQVGVAWRDPVTELTRAARKWDEAAVGWAATGAVAAAVMAPFLTTVSTAEVYIDAKNDFTLERCAEMIGLRPVEGGRLTLTGFPTATTEAMATVADGLRVAPWPRVYVDLARAGVRGEEAAEHLRDVVNAR